MNYAIQAFREMIGVLPAAKHAGKRASSKARSFTHFNSSIHLEKNTIWITADLKSQSFFPDNRWRLVYKRLP
jgi:hypothetical protein